MKLLWAWLNHRTGLDDLTRQALDEPVPGGARWRYIWGSTLVFAFLLQMVTGLFLWLAYSPSSQTAWESVYYIQYRMEAGWLLRGIHHCTSEVLIVLLGLHLLQTVLDGAYKAPREMNFLFGLALLALMLALALTGYLLPWDQKGFWATKVATNILGIMPVIGPQLQQLALGGPEYGHHTLTRFFALHAGVLPQAIILLLAGHIYLFRRHGLTVKEPRRKPNCTFWPDQVFKDVLGCLGVLAVVLLLALRRHAQGGELGAPADPAETFHAARPEWYFLFLFQFLKYFPGSTEIWGAIIIPSVAFALVAAMPWIARSPWGHRFNLGFLGLLAVGIVTLTALALADDRREPAYQAAVATARQHADRAQELANTLGIPLTGAVTLLRNDPTLQGPALFAQYCASCHRYGGTDGLGRICPTRPFAADLKGYGSRVWLQGLLNPQRVASDQYFGGNAHRTGEMAKYVRSSVAAFSPEKQALLQTIIAAVSAEARLNAQRELDQHDQPLIAAGRQALVDGKLRCTECHQFGKPDPNTIGPDLTSYASRDWLVAFISNPAQPRFYGKRNDRMPKFGEDKVLSASAIGLIADWLRGDADAQPADTLVVKGP